jgi:hypothetical protein
VDKDTIICDFVEYECEHEGFNSNWIRFGYFNVRFVLQDDSICEYVLNPTWTKHQTTMDLDFSHKAFRVKEWRREKDNFIYFEDGLGGLIHCNI